MLRDRYFYNEEYRLAGKCNILTVSAHLRTLRENKNMLLPEAISLINNNIINQGQPAIWTDLGCGNGMFSQALSALLAPHSKIYAIDKIQQRQKIVTANETVTIPYIQADFEKDTLTLPPLDGIILANSIHYVQNKEALLHRLEQYMKLTAAFIIVEYDTMLANPWVPHPIDKKHLRQLFAQSRWTKFTDLGQRPSVYGHGNIYACLISKHE